MHDDRPSAVEPKITRSQARALLPLTYPPNLRAALCVTAQSAAHADQDVRRGADVRMPMR
jgi:hypothetical protein